MNTEPNGVTAMSESQRTEAPKMGAQPATDECRCQIVGWSRDPGEPHIPAQPEWEQADDCPIHPQETP